MPQLFVAVWAVNTTQFAISPDMRMDQLTRAVEKAWGIFSTMISTETDLVEGKSFHGTSDTQISLVFVAPEYLFTGAASHFMTETQQGIVRADLVFLSLRFPDLLLIPGSMGWFKTEVRSGMVLFRKKRTGNPGADQRSMGKYIERYSKAASEIPNYSKFPSFLQHLYKEEATQLQDHRSKEIGRLGEKENPPFRVAKNTCLVLHGCRVIHKYDKVFEAISSANPKERDLLPADQDHPVLFMPGNHSPVFEAKGIKYGLELCVDHNLGALRLYCENISSSAVDIQIVMSATTGLEDQTCIATRYVIQADAKGPYVRTQGSDTPIKPIVISEDLQVYDLSW